MRDSSLQGAQEIRDTLLQLAERQKVYQEEVQRALSKKEASTEEKKSPWELAATLLGFASTVLSMALSWQADRRDKKRLENENTELRAKLKTAAA